MKNKEVTPEQQRVKLLEYMKYAVLSHIDSYGADHAITLDAKKAWEEEQAKTA